MAEPISSNSREHSSDYDGIKLPYEYLIIVLALLALNLVGILGFISGIAGIYYAARAMQANKLKPTIYSTSTITRVKAGRILAILGIVIQAVLSFMMLGIPFTDDIWTLSTVLSVILT